MKIKRLFTTIMAVAVLAGSLAGCSGNKDPEPTPAVSIGEGTQTEKTDSSDSNSNSSETQSFELTVWSAQEDQVKSDQYPNGIVPYLCEEFNKEHPEWDITFKYGVMSEADAAEAVMKDLDAAADVFMYANDQIPKMVEAGALAKLGGKVVEDIQANNSEAMVGSVTYNDGVYGIPFTSNTYFLFYDKSKYSEEEVKSLDTMMEKDLGKGVYNFSYSIGNSWYLPAFFYAVGGELFGPDGNDETAGTTFGDYPEVTKYLVDLANNKKFFREENGASLAKFKDGTLGAYVTGSWDASAIKEGLGDNFGVTKLPTVKIGEKEGQMYSFAGSKVVGVNPTSKNMAPAVALAAYLGGEKAQTVRFQVRKIAPTWNAVAQLEEVKNDPVVSAEILQINEASKTQPLVKKMNDFWSPVESLGKSILQGDVTKENAQEATTKMGEGINK